MFELIEKLRQKSDGAKRRIAFFTAFSFSLVIFFVWISVIYPDIKNERSSASSNGSSTPVETLTSVLGEGFNQIGEKFVEIRSFVSSMSSTTLYYDASKESSAGGEIE